MSLDDFDRPREQTTSPRRLVGGYYTQARGIMETQLLTFEATDFEKPLHGGDFCAHACCGCADRDEAEVWLEYMYVVRVGVRRLLGD